MTVRPINCTIRGGREIGDRKNNLTTPCSGRTDSENHGEPHANTRLAEINQGTPIKVFRASSPGFDHGMLLFLR